MGSVLSGLAGIFKRRLVTFLLVAGAVFALAVAGVLLITPKYIATAMIKIDPHQNAMIGVEAQQNGNPDQSLIDTEVSVIQSRDIARTVVDELKLQADREFQPRIKPGDPSKPGYSQLDLVTDEVLDGLKVQRQKTTYVVDISFRSENALKAAKIANAFAASYINNSLGTRTGTASRQAEFLNNRLEQAAAELQQVEGQAAQYRAQAGVIGSGLSGGYTGTVADQQAASLSTQLSSAEAAASAAQSKLGVARAQMAQGGLDAVSAVLQSAVVTDLRRQRAEVVRNMGEIQARYGPKHPETLKVGQQLEQIDQQIDQEAQRVIGSLASDAASASAAVSTLRGQMSGIRGEQASNTRAGALAQSASQQADAKRQAYNQLAGEAQQATQLSRNTQTQAQVVELAVPPEYPAYPDKRLALAFAALAALALGLVTVAVQEVTSSGLRTIEDVESRFDIPFIVSVPRLSRSEVRAGGSRNPADILVETAVIPFAEAFRTARGTLLLGGSAPKVITFVSALPDEGKTTSVLSMARVMAMSGDRVVLLDCDLRKAGLSGVLNSTGEKGIVELLQGDAGLDEVLAQDVVPGLDYIPVAKPVFTPMDLFGTQRMRDLIAVLQQRYDHVLIDTPPLLGVADARTLAAQADAVIMLIKWNSTPHKSIGAGLAWLQQDRAPVVGAVYTMVDPKSEAIGAMYYSKRYSHYYQKA